MLTERTFDAGEVSLNYAEGPPAGPPLVLLHGATLRWQHFLPVIPLLGWRWHLYALDLRGHGRSGRGAYRADDYARDTLRFLREVVQAPAALLGHSLGGAVAVQVAAEAPDAVRALVLEDPGLFERPLAALADGAFYTRFGQYRDLLASRLSLGELVVALDALQTGMDAAALRARATALHQLDPGVLTRTMDDSVWDGYDRDALLARVTCPVLLLQGDPAAGGVLLDEEARRVASQLADCALVRMVEVGHGIHSAQPVAFAQMVMNFLESA